MKLAVDQNIPLPGSWLPDDIHLTRFDGRQLQPSQLNDIDALLVRSVTRVDRALLHSSPVQFVGSATAGTDHLDIGYLEQQGIHWCAAPGCNADAVVDYVLASMARLAIDPRQRKVGIVGCGQVGGRLYKRLNELGVSCLCHDPFLDPLEQSDLVSLERLLGECDLISLHTPLTTDGPFPTRGMIGQEELSLVAPQSTLISAGRGGVIDEDALLRRLRDHHDLRLVLDVWQTEPHINTELQGYAALATPHIAGYSALGKLRGTWMVLRRLIDRFALDWPLPEKFSIQPAMKLDAGLNWRAAILEVYDPSEDDMRLRDAFKVDGAAGFDRLRKNYPERLELGQCSTPDPSLSAWGFHSR